MKQSAPLLAGIALLAVSAPADAQLATPQSNQIDEGDAMDIVVTGTRLRGAVVGDIKPEVTFNAADVRSLGVSTVSELVNELSAQTGSGQGRGGESPIVLLNGGRISGFAEVRDIPTEAIARLEILPEEVALKYGYRATQKVMNIVLRRRFRAFLVELEGALPTQGGQWQGQGDATIFRTGDKGRLNLSLDYVRSTALTEAERDIIQQAPLFPYAAVGNISAVSSGAEIDPALSLLTGTVTAIAGVPAGLSRQPTLADFASGAVQETDIGAYRTLRAQTDTVTANAVYARPLSGGSTLSLNAGLTYKDSAGQRGLGTTSVILPAASGWSPFADDVRLNRYLTEFGVLEDWSRDWTAHLGTTVNGSASGWNWSLTANFDHADARSRNETGFDLSDVQARITGLDPLFNPYAVLDGGDARQLVNSSRSIANSGDARLVATGTPFSVPAGKASLTVTLGGKAMGLNSRSMRAGLLAAADLSRTEGNGQISLDIPITSRREGVLSGLGDLSVNFNAGYDHYSDAGGQRLIGAGLNWTPVKPLSVIASWSKDEGPPSIQQLGNPISTLTGVRVYDYVVGETVDIARVTGGNAGLTSDDRRVLKVGVTVKPLAKDDLSLTANYTDSRIDNPIAGFPAATAAIQAAFPTRFTRDANGRLTAIDARPINFAQSRQKEIRWGFNFSKQLAAPKSPAGGQPSVPGVQEAMRASGGSAGGPGMAHGGPGAGPGGSPRGFGGSGGGGMRGTRMQVAIYHTYRLEDGIQIAPGVPALDLLDGDATGGTGGVSRHDIRLQGGLTHNGMGVRLSGSWKSGTTVDSGADLLRFSSLATVNVRLFANLGMNRDLVKKIPFLRGTRIRLGVDNLFNQRQTVKDSAGETPLGFQPGYLDPLGRTVSLSFRKLFF